MVENIIVKENEFNGKVIKQVYLVIDKKEVLVGTIKEKENYSYLNCIHKEFKK